MNNKLLTKHLLKFLSLKKQASLDRLILHLSKCHIVGNHMSWLNYVIACRNANMDRPNRTNRCAKDETIQFP